MPAGWLVEGVALPAGDEGAWWVRDGQWVEGPAEGAEPLPGRYVLHGLVDAHCHLSLVPGRGFGPDPDRDPRSVRDRLLHVQRAGVLLLRDAGGVAGIPLGLAAEDPGRVQACGAFLAPPGQYFPAVHEPLARGSLVDGALAQVAAGARWVKLVGDFRRLDVEGAPVEPTYGAAEVRAMVDAVHAAGARVAAHTTTRYVADLVAAGVDSVEHGPALDEADLAALAARGGAWTPTLTAMLGPADGSEVGSEPGLAELCERLSHLLPVALSSGVRVLTGSDVVGSVPDEVRWLVRLGVDPVDALAAATTSARDYLGLPAGAVGTTADVVTYDEDPRADPERLANPAAVVLGGRVLWLRA